MYWQVDLCPPPDPVETAGWLPRDWFKAPPQQDASPSEANAGTRAMPTEDEQAVVYGAAVAAILNMAADYPGLIARVSHLALRKPGQSLVDHFDAFMGAVSDCTRDYQGLGLAISRTLLPFEKSGL